MSTPFNKNPRHIIKCSKWSMHKTWHVDIRQVTSANDRQHKSRFAHMSHDVCASFEIYRRKINSKKHVEYDVFNFNKFIYELSALIYYFSYFFYS